jgi:hypothetical protein
VLPDVDAIVRLNARQPVPVYHRVEASNLEIMRLEF